MVRRQYLKDVFHNKGKLGKGNNKDFNKDNKEGNSAQDLQYGHGTYIAGNIYAQLITKGTFKTISKRKQFRTISQEWHRFLGFQETQDTLIQRVRKKQKRSGQKKADRKFQLER